LLPYRRAAERFIKSHREDPYVANSRTALRNLLLDAGPVHLVSDVLHFLSPREKARAALARLRRAEIPPERLLTIALAVSAAVREDPIGPGGLPHEYRRVQIAKSAHRLQSGYDGFYGPRSSHERYPRSSGRALRHIGQMIDDCCARVIDAHLEAVLALKIERYGPREPLVLGKPLR